MAEGLALLPEQLWGLWSMSLGLGLRGVDAQTSR